jgi:hypothetical protein
MGCCASKESTTLLNDSHGNSSKARPSTVKKGKEDKIELAFKAKRANVYTIGVDLQRDGYSLKNIAKNANQIKTIC